MTNIFSAYEKYVHENEEKKETPKKEDDSILFNAENDNGKKDGENVNGST